LQSYKGSNPLYENKFIPEEIHFEIPTSLGKYLFVKDY